MDSTGSSGKRRPCRTAVRSALEGAAVAAAAAALAAALRPDAARDAAIGLGTGWLVSAGSFAAALHARERSPRAFIRAYVAGAAARALGLAGLMASVWSSGSQAQAVRLLSYVALVVILLLFDLRYIKEPWISTRY